MIAGNAIRVAVNGYGVIGKRVAGARGCNAQGIKFIVHPHVRCRPAARRSLRSGALETIDANRALTKAESDGKSSIAKTDATMGIGATRW